VTLSKPVRDPDVAPGLMPGPLDADQAETLSHHSLSIA